ncbi:MAG: uroporphyrinogen-III C-methyltransferase [Burkholderiaceae bacterium]
MKPQAPSLQTSGTSAARAVCTLVGAGPGDPELLTLKAVKAIQAATVLLVDDLVSDEIVALASASARVIHVGKRGGCRSTPQAFIDRLMVSEALAGENVVRLKGGDPFIFGRGGEEAQALRDAGIEVRVVNGITSGLAAVSSLGVPLTHRDHAHGVVFVTGHAKPGDGGTDWAALAASARDCKLTLVIYMGIAGVQQIRHGLLQSLPARTPAAVVQAASTPQQREVLTSLGELTGAIAREQLASPAVIVVGEVLSDAIAALQGRDLPQALRSAG